MKKLGFGLMRLPENGGAEYNGVDIDAVCKMVDYYMEHGFTYFDTAYFYHNGQSECVFKEAVADRYSRDKYVVADKLPIYSIKTPEGNQETFDEQLRKCGVKYFDYYLLHAMNADNYEMCKAVDSFGFIRKLKEEGKVKHIGFSFHDTAELLDEILTAHPEIEFVQLQINYLDWLDRNVNSKGCYEVAMKHGKDIIVMEPIKGGRLASIPDSLEHFLTDFDESKSIASWAVRYAAGLDKVFMVLSGMSNVEQLIDNVSYMNGFVPLTCEENESIELLAEELRKLVTIPCTKCNYCVDDCPQHIGIPELFQIFNDNCLYGNDSKFQSKYDDFTATAAKASTCIQCGNCQSRCPQKIVIIEWLQKIAEKYE